MRFEMTVGENRGKLALHAEHADVCQVFLCPNLKWNDFIFYQTEFSLSIKFPGDKNFEPYGTVKIMVEQDKATWRHFKKFANAAGLVDLANFPDPFLTVFQDSDSYRNLRLKFLEGQEQLLIPLLTALNDYPIVAKMDGDDSAVKVARDPNVKLADLPGFTKSLIRSSGAYFCSMHGFELASTDFYYQIDLPPPALDLTMKLSSCTAPHEFSFHYSEPSAPFFNRIKIVIGRNGVGKTQALRKIVKDYSAPTQRQIGGNDRLINKLVYYSSAFDVSAIEPAQGQRPLPKTALVVRRLFGNEMRLSLGFVHSVIDLLYKSARFRGDRWKADMLAELVAAITGGAILAVALADGTSQVADYEFKGKKYLALSSLFLGGEEQIHDRLLALSRTRLIQFFRATIEAGPVADGQSAGHAAVLEELSTGQAALVQMLVTALADAEPQTLFLLDEPDTYLHPNFISLFMLKLAEVLERTRSYALIATHSIFVVREIPKNDIHIIELQDHNAPLVWCPKIQTFGANLDMLAIYIFGDDDIAKRFESQLLHAYQGMDIAEVVANHAGILNADNIDFLADHQPDRVGASVEEQ